jgi:hypothetical protein
VIDLTGFPEQFLSLKGNGYFQNSHVILRCPDQIAPRLKARRLELKLTQDQFCAHRSGDCGQMEPGVA